MSDPTEPSEPTSDPQNIEDELDAALAALDSEPLPTTTLPDPSPSPEQASGDQVPGEPTPPAFTPEPSTGSPTLDALDESRRPKASTVCERCPNSVWFASPAEVKCYCRVMFLVTWSSKEPSQITNCDGEFLGQEQGVEAAPPGLAAADKYIAEREAKRSKGFDIPKHARYTAGDGALAFQGVRNIEGQALALLKRGDEVMVMPIDQATARRLSRIAVGDAVTITPKGSIKTSKGRSR